ncbi:MAG: Gfo/Idh/MocA family oxidoreductase [Planctomycetaceae bacterium]
MSESTQPGISRRDLLKTSGQVAAAATLAGSLAPYVHAGVNETVQLALVGCGGRGTGAIANALSTTSGPTKLVAVADAFPDRLEKSFKITKDKFDKQVEVPDDHKFVGFDAYKKAMDCLKPGDVVLLTTPPAFRWLMFQYAIEKGLNVFMEKPITVDGPTTRRIIELGKKASEKNLKVGVGLMCRHCVARQELHDRIKDGQIGDVLLIRAYRVAGPTGHAFVKPKPADVNELEYQIRNFHGFLWASGGAVSDFLIHNIDESCWMKDEWPVDVKGYGGRHYRGDNIDQNFDVYTMEYTFADGTKMMVEGRYMDGCQNEFASYVHGSKGCGVISTSGHHPAKCRIYKGQRFVKEDQVWAYPPNEPNPYQLEWDHLIEAIRKDKPYNEVERGAMASAVTSMGRMACHTGQLIRLDEFLNLDHEFAPNLADLKVGGPAPLLADANGKYPIPLPGIVTNKEYSVG